MIDKNELLKIIHCKECQHRNDPLACKLESEGMHMPDDWFCADGCPATNPCDECERECRTCGERLSYENDWSS